VTISGLVDINYGTVNAPGNVLGNQTGDISRVAHNGTATTNITISGTEDLGGGMRALFRYEMNPDFVNGSGLTGGAGATGYSAGSSSTSLGNGANGYSFVGVSSQSLGAVRLGRLNTGTLSAWGTGSVFGTALGSGFGSNGNVFTSYSSSAGNFNNSAPVRFNGAVEWTSPAINSFTARVLYVPQVNKPGIGGESACTDSTTCTTAGTLAAGANRAGATDFSLAYNKGPLNAIIAQQTIKVGSNDVSALVSPNLLSTASQTSKLTTAAANYTIGATTVYGAYWTEKQGTAVDAQAYMLGAKYTMGATSLMASMGNRNDKTSNNVDKKVLGIGAEYALSKRSALYARFETRDANTNSGADTAAAGATKTTAVGVRHSF
jgi:predicted porin